MKKVILISAVSMLSGCSIFGSSDPIAKLPNTEVMVDKSTYVMSRNEMINAIMDCEASGTRPVVLTTRRKVNGFLSEAPFDVTCMPKYIK
jgi:hypothetical protein